MPAAGLEIKHSREQLRIEMPRQWHGEFYQCWTGDPHYTCRALATSPLLAKTAET